ncbi:MAG: flagellar filament capping protein FliD [FCB group bacterium]|nr:flagellar filament capping protein FliD [FCB group bacterium]
MPNTISGLVSGIDWATTIDQLIAVESRPIVLLDERKQENETKLSMWNQLNGKLLALESTASSLTDRDIFASRTASSTDSDYLTTSATGSASPGTHLISSITTIARANNFVAGTGYSSADDTFGQAAGDFIINFANHPDGAQALTLSYGTDYSAATSIDELVDLINNHPDNDGLLTASLINDGSGATPYKVILTAANTGTDYEITSITDTSTGLVMAEGLTAQNLTFNIDSIDITKSSNQVTDVIDGVTMNFHDTGIASDIIITVENDMATIKSNINSLVNAYNDVKAFMNMVSSFDEDTETMGPLLGDGNLASIKARLAAVISNQVPGLPSTARFSNLSQIGINTNDENGLMSVKSSTLDDALEEDYDAVADVFCDNATSDNSSISFVQKTTKTQAGSYNVVVDYDGSGQMTSATINGETANILGSLVQGVSGTDAEGLLLKFTWPGSGSQQTGTINLSSGVNVQFENEIDYITGEELEEGEVYWATESLGDTIENLDEQIVSMEERLVAKRERYEREFTELEMVMSQLQSQSQYLSALLS